MSPEEESSPSSTPSEAAQAPGQIRRGRRSGRHRGRGRRRRPSSAPPRGVAPEEVHAAPPSLDESDQFPTEPDEVSAQESSEFREPQAADAPEPVPQPESLPEEAPRQTPPATLEEAIEQVNRVVESLRQSLNDMEEVLELLEVLERQTGADQREIESLRRALRQFHRPPERSHHHRGRG